MLPFKRILFPVNYSDICRASVPYVAEMTRHYSAQLTVVHAYSNTDWLKQVDKRGDRQLREFVTEAFPSQTVDAILEEADPANAIDMLVQRQKSDLVMLPTRGLNGIGRSHSGSIVDKVLKTIDVAVWTCTASALEDRPHDVAYKSILCATNFSQETASVLRAAAALASSYDARLSLVHVVEASEPDGIRAANDRLSACKDQLGITAPHKILWGRTAGALRQEAVEEKADLIVAGRGLSQGTLTKSLSELYEIVCEAPCPVLRI